MNKCDFCPHSRQDKDRKLICPYVICILSEKELKDILKIIIEIKK